MGGYGSGWQGPRKQVVEECLTLPMKFLVREGVVRPGTHRLGSLSWRNGREEVTGRIGYLVDTLEPDRPHLRLAYQVRDIDMDYRVDLDTTRPNFGGLRWWFLCPCSGRRAAKLHLPPGGRYFAHREVHGLTYTSCRESGRFQALAAGLGLSEGELKRQFRG